MTSVIIVFQLLALVAFGYVIWSSWKLHQLTKFSAFLRTKMDYEWERRITHRESIPSIDIDASIDNLNRSVPWNFEFETMIVRSY